LLVVANRVVHPEPIKQDLSLMPGLRAPVYWFAENPACECVPICWL
jgi:hypothetical protein